MRRYKPIYLYGFAANLLAAALASCDSSGYLPGITSGGGSAGEVIRSSLLGKLLGLLGVL